MAEATPVRDDGAVVQTVPTGGYSAGQVIQLADGRAAFVAGASARSAGEPAALQTEGIVLLTKSTGLVCLKGGRAYWDRSANAVTPLQSDADGDFFCGVFTADGASGDTTIQVDLNAQPSYNIDLQRDAFDTVIVKTAGTPSLDARGGSLYMLFSATAEAQKVDLLSKKAIPHATPFIAEFRVACYDKGDAAALDFSLGIANATHATDADAITESVFVHMDGNALDIKAESDDGTTEVAATDTTVDAVDDTYFDVWIDARDKSNVKIYVDGVRVLSATTFAVSAATGPWKILAHLEKTSDDTPGDFRIVHAAIRATDLVS